MRHATIGVGLASATVAAALGCDPKAGDLDLTSLNFRGTHQVRVAWDPADAGSAVIERESGGNVATLSATSSPYIDSGVSVATVSYRVSVAGRKYAGTIAPLAQPDCGSAPPPGPGAPGTGEGKPAAAGGPPECAWRLISPGTTPFAYFKQGQAIPLAGAPTELVWSDEATRSGYRVEFGPAILGDAPPPTFNGQVVAYTKAKTIKNGQKPGIPGFTDASSFMALLAAAGQGDQPWPTERSGGLYGWRICPVVVSPDGHSAAIGEPALFPRIFKSR